MKKNRRLSSALIALFALPFVACDCSETPTATAKPGIKATPEFASWGDVCNETADVQEITITNTGRGALNAREVTIEGRDAAFFSLEEGQERFTIAGAAGTYVLRITHLSIGDELGKQHEATLVIHSNAGDEPLTLPLSADVANLPATPVLSFSCADTLPACGVENETCCLGSGSQISFGQIAIEDVATATLRVANRGCGVLDVSDVVIETLGTGDTCSTMESEDGVPFEQVTVKGFAPFTLAGTFDPNSPKTQDITFEFAPVDSLCTVNRQYNLITNDPAATPGEVGASAGLLSGQAVQGLLTINPGPANFGQVRSGETKELPPEPKYPEPVRSHIEIRNSSDLAVIIEGVRLENAGITQDKDQFELAELARCCPGVPCVTFGFNETITMAKSSGKPASESCEDRLYAKVRYKPTRPSQSHQARLVLDHPASLPTTTSSVLAGSSAPKAVPYPGVVSFGMASEAGCTTADLGTCPARACRSTCVDDDACPSSSKCVDGICSDPFIDLVKVCAPICGVAERDVAICNNGYANLSISNVEITDVVGGAAPVDGTSPGNPPVYSVTNRCVGTEVAPDACCTETVSFRDPRMGTNSQAHLWVQTNDPSWNDPKGMLIDLTSNSLEDPSNPGAALGRIPVVPFPTAPPFPMELEWVELDATAAHVDLGEITSFRWKLKSVVGAVKHPWGERGEIDPTDPNKNCPDTVNNGQCVQMRGPGKIAFWTERAGFEYTWEVTVTGGLCDPEWSATSPVTVVPRAQDGT